MPVWLRKFTFKQISDFYDEKNKAQKAAQTSGKTSLVGEDGKVNVPAFKNASKTNISFIKFLSIYIP